MRTHKSTTQVEKWEVTMDSKTCKHGNDCQEGKSFYTLWFPGNKKHSMQGHVGKHQHGCGAGVGGNVCKSLHCGFCGKSRRSRVRRFRTG